jgi:hypothetical protein
VTRAGEFGPDVRRRRASSRELVVIELDEAVLGDPKPRCAGNAYPTTKSMDAASIGPGHLWELLEKSFLLGSRQGPVSDPETTRKMGVA